MNHESDPKSESTAAIEGFDPWSMQRQDPLSGEWVLFAPGRALRPSDFGRDRSESQVEWTNQEEALRERCPFCPGNEADTMPTLEAWPPNGPWIVRAFGNKYPVVAPPSSVPTLKSEPLSSLSSFPSPKNQALVAPGVHEVVVESADHEADWTRMPVDHLLALLSLLCSRAKKAEESAYVKHVSVFRNVGAAAGATRAHPHAQILGTAFVPHRIETMGRRATEALIADGVCPWCQMADDCGPNHPHFVCGDSHFVAMAPEVPRVPHEVMILPRRCAPRFPMATTDELRSLASMLKGIISALTTCAELVAYNVEWRSGTNAMPVALNSPQGANQFALAIDAQQALPNGPDQVGNNAPTTQGAAFRPLHFHWHVVIVPRKGQLGGLEWSTGTLVNTVPAAVAAKLAREALQATDNGLGA